MRKTNGYGWFTAEYCRSTGLPMYDKISYASVADKYLSKTRCAKIKRPVKEDEEYVESIKEDIKLNTSVLHII